MRILWELSKEIERSYSYHKDANTYSSQGWYESNWFIVASKSKFKLVFKQKKLKNWDSMIYFWRVKVGLTILLLEDTSIKMIRIFIDVVRAWEYEREGKSEEINEFFERFWKLTHCGCEVKGPWVGYK